MAKSKEQPKKIKKTAAKSKKTVEPQKVSAAVPDAIISKQPKPVTQKSGKAKPVKANGKVAPDQVEQRSETLEKVEDLAAAFSSLPIKQQIFIEEYLIDANATQAAIRAGYSMASAYAIGSRVRHIPAVAAIIEARLEDRFERSRMTTDRLLSEYEHMAEADFNELVEYRRVNCRHCWGIGFKYQYNFIEQDDRRESYDRQVIEAVSKGIDEATIAPFDEHGGIGYLPNKEPNAECPVCAGEGIGEVFFKDTRFLSRRARSIYAGAEVGKDGIKVKGYSKEKAMDTIARANKLFNDAADVNFNVTASPELMALYEIGMKNAKTRDEKVIGRSKRMADSEQAG